MTRTRIYLASLAVSLLSVTLFVGCQRPGLGQYPKAQPATQPVAVAATRPAATQPAAVAVAVPNAQPPATVTAQPIIQAADVAAAFYSQYSGVIYAILALAGVSAAGHITNIAKTAVGAYQSVRSGTATAGTLLQAGESVATEVAALDPKAAPAIQKVEQAGAAIAAAASAVPKQ